MNINVSKAKIVVNIPEDYLDVVRNAILDAGAGVIGNYTHCSNTSKIIGTFSLFSIYSLFLNALFGKYSKLAHPA